MAVIAGPGTGKTTTLAGRITHLVRQRGAEPSSILALTFTTEAARRLRREVARQLGDRAHEVSILTLHALGRKVIDTWAGQLGYDERPAVLHHAEARALLTSAASHLGWDPTTFPVGELAPAVDRCRLLPDEGARQSDPLARLADVYEELLRRHGAIDFVSMLALPLRLFRADERILRMLQDAHRWVLVDEAQDMDRTQWTLIELLAARHGNLLVAGDASQSIFSWRGADHRALLRFPERYPSATVITLDLCHRSTGHLVAVGNALSDLLAYRPPLRTDNPPGPFPRLLLAEDEHAEAEFVAQQIGALLDRELLPHPGEAAVLFRTRAQADVVASALRTAGVPYALHGNPDVFGARVVRDALAYLHLAVNPGDRAALARIVDRPPRGLGRLAATLLEEPATTAELPGRAAEFGPAAVASATALMATIYDLHAEAGRGSSATALLDRALERSGYFAWLERHPEGTSRLRTLAHLRGLAQRAELPPAEWLDALAIGDAVVSGEDQVVHLSSVHLAKGREFLATWTVGLEEGLVPHYRAIVGTHAGETAVEEELRVLYVGLTRARERLHLSACRERTRGSQTERRQPSRWLATLPPEFLAPAGV
jgi:DNA helicase-2/ATP-dependent DNA helicase PcrA